jgi:transcriptional regulator with XRE-family HTH domain
MKLARKIKEARESAHLTQTQLGAKIGLSTQSISAFETGRIKPSSKYLGLIAQITHQPVYFFTGQKMAEALDRLTKLEQEAATIKQLLLDAASDEE